MLLRITEQAADQIRASIEEGGMQGMALRVAARRLEDGTIDYSKFVKIAAKQVADCPCPKAACCYICLRWGLSAVL